MSQLNVYKYGILLLALMNIGLVAFFLLKTGPKPPPAHPPKKDKGLIEMLNLYEDQENIIFKSAEEHQSKIIDLEKEQRAKLGQYLGQLTNGEEVIDEESILKDLQEIEKTKIQLTLAHLKEVKSVLRDDQMDFFQEFMNHVLNPKKGGDRRGGPPRRKGNLDRKSNR